MDKQQVHFKDLGVIDYKSAWDYQEELVKANVDIKTEARKNSTNQIQHSIFNAQYSTPNTQHTALLEELPTLNHLLFCEHPPVYTLGKSGSMKNVLLSEEEMDEREIEFFKTNRGGDITFHGLQQIGLGNDQCVHQHNLHL